MYECFRAWAFRNNGCGAVWRGNEQEIVLIPASSLPIAVEKLHLANIMYLVAFLMLISSLPIFENVARGVG